MTARVDNRPPVTLGTLGALLPRPQGHGSPLLSPRTIMQPPPPRSAVQPQAIPAMPPDTRSGVVYERDGFELFYGLNGDQKEHNTADRAAPKEKPRRDGYEKFYGIRSSDRRPAAPASGRGASTDLGAPAAAGGYLAADAQKPVRSGAQVAAPVQGGGYKFKVCPPKPRMAQKENVEVPSFSMATPVPSFAPPIVSKPGGPQVFSVGTPMPPPPAADGVGSPAKASPTKVAASPCRAPLSPCNGWAM